MYNSENAEPVAMIPQNGCMHKGLTILDYFAAKVMQSLGNEINAPYDQHEETFDRVVRSSYMMAAKMMEERKKYLEPPLKAE